MKQNRFSDVLGLRLSRQALRVLKERGIFAHSPVSLEHQHLVCCPINNLQYSRCNGKLRYAHRTPQA